ncbi:hypothetical protein K503DRAFT_766454 [Rhizopogon vinicolor AM-OR11-026]|uniref:Chitin-binding type-2 domain-containing protein n=1 Tax=Rhizopogon vinicolor AM-OR11-026 TaxID=1314800 RepID=A0A1B7ND09_9AGAM|nr:hypothetical protein K503DRAFT_766454 [Rhizopogon vinicolor AM-OR11-026]
MKFVSLATMVTSSLVLAGITTAAASSPLGGPCASKNQYECGNEPNYNNNNDFVFYCTSANKIAYIHDCDCSGCCTIEDKAAVC